MITVKQPNDADRSAMLALVEQVATADGVPPVNESAELVISGTREGWFAIARDGDRIVGFAVADPRELTIQATVAPDFRRRGIGTGLLREALAANPGHSVWAFGTQPAAAALAQGLGLRPVRELLKLARPLGDEPVGEVPEGYRIEPFTDADAEGVVAVNALAFAHHPEQGKLTVEEFWQLAGQPWFSREGLFVAHHGTDVAGFHWTKRHDEDTGEVYVLAVHPAHSGAGLGRVLLETGLRHLADIGCTRVELYVEADQERVVRLYRSASFEQVNLDTSFAPQSTED